MNFGGLIYAALIFTQTAWSVFGLEDEQSLYYEHWTRRFDSVQFEMKILRNKVTKGERQLATMRSELQSLRAAKSSKAEICNKTDMRGPIAVNDVDAVDDNAVHVLRHAFMNEKLYTRKLEQRVHVLRHAFMNEKLYTRKLEQRVQTALLNATNSMHQTGTENRPESARPHQVRERINVTEEKCKSAFDEISRQITSLENYTKTLQESQQSKHEETSKAIDRLTMNEQLNTRKLEQRVQTAFLNATNSIHQVRERINVTEEKCKSAFDEISRQMTSLEKYTNTSQKSQQSKQEEISKAIDILTMNEQLNKGKLEKRVQTALLDATNTMHQVKEWINAMEEKSKNASDEISRQMTSLDRYTKTSQESQQSKHEETSKAIDRLTKDLARMNQESKQEETMKAIDRLTKDIARMNQESKQEETFKAIDKLIKDVASMNQEPKQEESPRLPNHHREIDPLDEYFDKFEDYW